MDVLEEEATINILMVISKMRRIREEVNMRKLIMKLRIHTEVEGSEDEVAWIEMILKDLGEEEVL